MDTSVKLMSAFVALIIGIVLIASVATTTGAVTALSTKTVDVDISSVRIEDGGINYTAALHIDADDILSPDAGSNWRTDYSDCAITYVSYYNQSGALMSNSADYTWTEDGNGAYGNLRPKNVLNLNSSGSNATTLTYNYCSDGYLTQGWTRSVTNMIAGFFALSLMAVSIGLFYSVMKDEGLLNI